MTLEWNWEPSVVLGVLLFIGAYLGAIRFSRKIEPGQIVWFILGMLVILFALVSPLDQLSDDYLFSAHMVQHLLLTSIAPPLLLLGTPGWMLHPLLRQPIITHSVHGLANPIVAFALFNVTFLTWHLPILYEATLHNDFIHIAEHLSFVAAGTVNWIPILSPLSDFRLPRPAQILYLFLDGVPMTILGALIVFAPTVLYPKYANAPRILGLSALDDQQIAGLVMWMVGGMVYLVAISIVFFAWVGDEDRDIHSLNPKMEREDSPKESA